MRRLGTAAGFALATALLSGAAGLGIAAADEPVPEVPSQQEVRGAEAATQAAAGSVAEVRARLVVAGARLEAASVAAARAAEAFNGARYRAQQARLAVRDARAGSTAAAAGQEVLRQQYAELLLSSYQSNPELAALSAITHADGLSSMLETTSALRAGQSALDERYDELRAATALARSAADRAEAAEDEAARSAEEARDARDAAGAAVDAAAAEAAAVAEEKARLIADLARLQGVSVDLAARRQAGLEARAAAAAAAATEAAATEAAATEAAAAETTAEPAPEQDAAEPTPTPTPTPTPAPETETPEAPEAPEAPQAPAPSSGASAAVAFARAQIGEPYRWGAAGPSAWDCSGLTAGAWAAGGTSLPHYSVAQYEQATPIERGDLRPGDLLFWGSSDSASSIYHVALYVGDAMMVHAPRTGRPVVEESMYSWIPPTLYARP